MNQRDQTNQIDQIDQMNQIDQTDQRDQMNQRGWSFGTHFLLLGQIRVAVLHVVRNSRGL